MRCRVVKAQGREPLITLQMSHDAFERLNAVIAADLEMLEARNGGDELRDRRFSASNRNEYSSRNFANEVGVVDLAYVYCECLLGPRDNDRSESRRVDREDRALRGWGDSREGERRWRSHRGAGVDSQAPSCWGKPYEAGYQSISKQNRKKSQSHH